jgi:hypothetical protein
MVRRLRLIQRDVFFHETMPIMFSGTRYDYKQVLERELEQRAKDHKLPPLQTIPEMDSKQMSHQESQEERQNDNKIFLLRRQHVTVVMAVIYDKYQSQSRAQLLLQCMVFFEKLLYFCWSMAFQWGYGMTTPH